MIFIYERGGGRGTGLNLRAFISRFDEICEQHTKEGRVKSFAFIFYNFLDKDIQRILKDPGVFTKLDRLSGSDLNIFTLHAERKNAIDDFNATFGERLGVEINPPCVCFFKFEDKEIRNVTVAQLDSADLIHGFSELYGVVEAYMKNDTAVRGNLVVRWIKSGSKFVSVETMRALIRQGVEAIF